MIGSGRAWARPRSRARIRSESCPNSSKELTQKIKNEVGLSPQQQIACILDEYNGKGNVTPINYVTYTDTSITTVKELYVKPREELRSRFFKSNGRGDASLAEQIFNQDADIFNGVAY